MYNSSDEKVVNDSSNTTLKINSVYVISNDVIGKWIAADLDMSPPSE